MADSLRPPSFLLRMRPVLKRCKTGKEEANHARTTKEVNCSLLLLLPVDLIYDILSRLPIYTLFSCKLVCKTFKSIFLDPCFAQLHLAKSSREDSSLLIQGQNPSDIFWTPLLGLDNCDGEYFSWQSLTMPSLIPNTRTVSYPIGSCNGFLCIRYFLVKEKVIYFCVCNPILGEFIILPQFRGEFTVEFGGFGFCPKTKQYKVLRFFPRLQYCDIFTLGTDRDWRRVNDAPPCPAMVVDFDSSYRGNLNWIIESTNSICSFNLETERYSNISLPPRSYASYQIGTTYQIGTLDGLFCASMFHDYVFEVHVMEEYGENEPWIKRVSIDIGYHVNQVKFLDNGVLVYSDPTRKLVYYDIRKGTTLDLLVQGRYCAIVHIPSLVSLKDIVRENVEQVERKIFHVFSSLVRKRQGK